MTAKAETHTKSETSERTLEPKEATREAYTARVLLVYPDDHRGRQYGSRVKLLAFVDALFEQFWDDAGDALT
jgi:hypothetical protein